MAWEEPLLLPSEEQEQVIPRLTWNGININHPMLGQSDLSLIPAGLIDDIQIYYGGASMPLNSGGIGGIINLETKPVWKKRH